MSDRVLTLAEVAEKKIIPLSKSSLYRAAEEGDGPFYKVRGRWLAFESELLAWVREGEKGSPSGPPAATSEPSSRRNYPGEGLLAEVHALRGAPNSRC